MSADAIERYLSQLRDALHVRGAARRRFLSECREHLADAASERGAAAAVQAFGPAEEVAAAFDAEIAARRGLRSTYATAAGVLATGGSTLALLQAADAGASAPTLWAIVFFVAAQVAGVAATLGLVQALAQRREAMSAAEVLLLSRRNGCALFASAVTMFAAGAAVPGQGSAVVLLAGPLLACGASVGVLRARRLARGLDGAGAVAERPPLADLSRVVRLPLPSLSSGRLLLLVTAAAAAAAFVRDQGERATVGQALVTSAIEAAAVAGGFLVLGRPLGIRSNRR